MKQSLTMALRWVNRRGLLALIRVTWIAWLQERSFFFLLAFSWMIPPLIYLFVWAAAAGERTVGGFTRGELVAYYLALIMVNQLTYAQVNWTVGDVIRNGALNTLLLRPQTPFANALATEVAGKGVYLLFVVPVTLLLALILHPSAKLSLVNVCAFFPALLLAWLLRFLWGYWLALLAFWTTRFEALHVVQVALTFLFGGQVAPPTLLPGVMQTVGLALPFRYLLAFPVELLVNRLDAHAILLGFALQLGWLALALCLSMTLWRTGLRHYTAIGG